MEEISENLADKLLPATIVNKILKGSLPQGIHLSKEVKKAMAHAGSIFILYITNIASEISHETQGKKKKAIISPEHIIQALEEMEFRNISQTCEQSTKRKPN